MHPEDRRQLGRRCGEVVDKEEVRDWLAEEVSDDPTNPPPVLSYARPQPKKPFSFFDFMNRAHYWMTWAAIIIIVASVVVPLAMWLFGA